MNHPRVAVIGAGLAGSVCAQRLAEADVEVELFDKSRGVGGRMSTRRAGWTDADGQSHEAAFDHGAPCFSAPSAPFRAAVQDAEARGWLARWPAAMAPTGFQPLSPEPLWVGTPAMPRWCQALVAGLALRLNARVDAIRRDADRAGGRWALAVDGTDPAQGFSHVVLALPPAQAAVLLQPHRADWAQRAAAWPMRPCWALMGVAAAGPRGPAWDAIRPLDGPLAWLARNGAKPGRSVTPGVDAWVAQATGDWSQTHLESTADDVQARLSDAVAAVLAHPLDWRARWVHRWRYANAPRHSTSAAEPPSWFDPATGLGACGDHLGGGGVEGAWLSGQAMADALLASIDSRA